MLQKIANFTQIEPFVYQMQEDSCYSEPVLADDDTLSQNLIRSIESPNRHDTFGVYREGLLTGVFCFTVLREERYLEMLVGLSREKAAYAEILAYLSAQYPGYHAGFVFNPKNELMINELRARGAVFYPEQRKMLYRDAFLPAVKQEDAVVLYAPEYRAAYIALHNDSGGRYWTAEKVLQATDKFRVLLALREGKVVGYIDVTYSFAENEPYDLFVDPAYRRLGYARALMTKALRLNAPHWMMLLVDADNFPAIRLYESLGFERDERGDSVTAYFTV